MRARSKTNKVLDIALSEEKFYFPGETIRGSVIVKPKSSMKVNPIIIKFSGAIFISAKDKEVIPLFQNVKSLPINGGKSKILEAKQYSFPFEFLVPKNLPSAMDFGKNKTARINYKLTVVLDRPMMPESLCPKIEYPVLVLEYVDVTKDSFVKSIEKQKEVLTSNNGKCHAKLSVPRNGFTRGETIPVNVIVNTFQSFVKKESLVIELIRKVKIQTSRNLVDEEHILKSNKFDLNIIGPYNFTQSITSQLLIRTTPPTIRYKDRVLRVHYKIRAQVFTENKKTPNIILELPIIIGTWPRADVPIDDDDDDDIIQNMGEVMISDEIDDDDDWMEHQEEIEFQKHSNHPLSPTLPSPTSTHYSGYYNNNNNTNVSVRRSGSNNSLGSMSSWISHSTMDPRKSIIATSPISTSGVSNNSNNSTNNNNNNNIPENYQRNTLPPVGFNVPNGYLSRSSSTPDLVTTSPPPQQQQQQQQRTARVIDPTFRSSYYESQSTNTINAGHRTSKSLHSIHPSLLNFTPVSQQHRRVGSDDFNFSNSTSTTFPVSPQMIHDPEVPNHTLTFLSSTSAPPPTPPPRIVTQPLGNNEMDSDIDEEEEEDDSDDDLFAIIERKKKKKEKEVKRRQRLMYTLSE